MIVLISINVPFLITFIAIKITIQKSLCGLQLSSLFVDILLKGLQNMKYIVMLLSLSFVPYVLSMHTMTSIDIKNNTNQTVWIAYREPACTILEKVQSHQGLTLSSTTPFLAIMNHGKIERFRMQHKRHYFIIEAAKSNYKDELKISEYDDRYVVRSKNDYLYDDPIFQ